MRQSFLLLLLVNVLMTILYWFLLCCFSHSLIFIQKTVLNIVLKCLPIKQEKYIFNTTLQTDKHLKTYSNIFRP